MQPNDHDHSGKANADRMLAVAKDHIQVLFSVSFCYAIDDVKDKVLFLIFFL